MSWSLSARPDSEHTGKSGFPDDSAFLSAIIEMQRDLAAVELDPQMVMRIAAQRAEKLANCDGASFHLLDGDFLVCEFGSGIKEGQTGVRLTLEKSLSGCAARTGMAQYASDCEADPRVDAAATRRVGFRSLLAIPLCHGGSTLGVLCMASRRAGAFDPRQVSALTMIAGFVAASFTHASEFEIKKKLLAQRTQSLVALQQSEERFRSSFEHAAIGKVHVAPDGRFMLVNPFFCNIVGYTSKELLAMDFQSITHPDDVKNNMSWMRRMSAGEISDYQVVKRYIHKKGHEVWAKLSAAVIRDGSGKPLYLAAQVQDITEQKRAERFQQDRGRVLEMIAQDLPLEKVLDELTQAIGRQMPGSPAALMVVRGGDVEIHGSSLPTGWREGLESRALRLAEKLSRCTWGGDSDGMTLIETDEAWSDLRGLAAQHGLRACRVSAIQSRDGSALGLVMVFSRETRPPTAQERQSLDSWAKLAALCIDHHNRARELAHLVRHDALTGLPNRMLLEDRLGQAVALAGRSGRQVAVMMLDIDNFKRINDILGHSVGDLLLQQFSNRLRGHLRETDTMARVGGDEFTIILPELTSPQGATAVAQKLVDAMVESFDLAGRTVAATVSIGIAFFPQDGSEAASLQQKADAALYRMKVRGRNGFCE